jgi:hypothetical protein
MLLARLFLLSRTNRAQEALRFVNYVACLGLCDYRQFGDQHIFGRAAGPSVRQSSVRVNAIGHELLPLSKDLDLALCAIRQKELRGLKLGERVLGLIDEEELRWPADANERRRAEADLDQADELVDDLLVQDVDVETNDLAAQHSRIECASIWGNFRCRWRILAGQLAPLPARLLARVLERFSVVIDPLIGIPHFERPISVAQYRRRRANTMSAGLSPVMGRLAPRLRRGFHSSPSRQRSPSMRWVHQAPGSVWRRTTRQPSGRTWRRGRHRGISPASACSQRFATRTDAPAGCRAAPRCAIFLSVGVVEPPGPCRGQPRGRVVFGHRQAA